MASGFTQSGGLCESALARRWGKRDSDWSMARLFNLWIWFASICSCVSRVAVRAMGRDGCPSRPGERIAQVRCLRHALRGGPLRRAVPASLADYSDGGDGGSSFHTSRVLWSGRWAGTVVPTVRAKGSRRCGACATRYAAARCGERSLPFSWPGSPLHWVSAFSTPSLRAGMAQRGQRGLSREEIETYLKRLECAGKRAIIGKGNCRA